MHIRGETDVDDLKVLVCEHLVNVCIEIDALKVASYGCAEVDLLLCVKLIFVYVADSDELDGEAFVLKNVVAVLVRLCYSTKSEKSKFDFSHNKLLLILAINVELWYN